MTQTAYIFQADLWCDDCAEKIKDEFRPEDRPDDDDLPDSDSWPCEVTGSLESDSPDHCAAGAECINAEELESGDRIGALLTDELTDEGVAYVREKLTNEPSEVVKFWGESFGLEPYFKATNKAQELAGQLQNGNFEHVLTELDEMSPMQAAATSLYLRSYFPFNDRILLALAERLDKEAETD